MGWRITFHPRVDKFLKTLKYDYKRYVQVKQGLNLLLKALESGVLPYSGLDVKKLRGEWEGFFRLRIGDMRILFTLDFRNEIVYVYNIHFRSKIYK